MPDVADVSLAIAGPALGAAVGVAALATLYIGILPNRFIEIVNWALGIAQNPAIAKLTH